MRLILRHDSDREDGAAACRHEWCAAYLPMEVGALSELLFGARCPVCGGAEGIKATGTQEPRVGEVVP